MIPILDKIKSFSVIFWDFDGVIKESVEIKGKAFAKLFETSDKAIVNRILEHHDSHGGISRFDKIPLYLEWASFPSTPSMINTYLDRFSHLVKQAIIDSDWVPGVETYLRTNHFNQIFVLLSATPQSEMESILSELNLIACFFKIYGAPKPKNDAIESVLTHLRVAKDKALMIGDSEADLTAARMAGIHFLLRVHKNNQKFFKNYSGIFIEDFI